MMKGKQRGKHGERSRIRTRLQRKVPNPTLSNPPNRRRTLWVDVHMLDSPLIKGQRMLLVLPHLPSFLPTGSSYLTPTQYPAGSPLHSFPTNIISPRLAPGSTSQRSPTCHDETFSGLKQSFDLNCVSIWTKVGLSLDDLLVGKRRISSCFKKRQVLLAPEPKRLVEVEARYYLNPHISKETLHGTPGKCSDVVALKVT